MIAGQKLRAFREKRGITQAQLAKELGVSKQAMTSKEKGDNGPEAAEAYLNGVLALAGEPARVTVGIKISAPSGTSAFYRELQEIVS